MKPKRQQRTVGSIVQIDLKDGTLAYAQILDKALAFFDFHSTGEISLGEINNAYDSDVLFFLAVYDNIITGGRWKKIGKRPLKPEHVILPMKFIQDRSSGITKLYDPNTGDISAATINDCRGLERSAVWGAEHVESRLRDTFSGKANKWSTSMALVEQSTS
jgi:hypothetical protein